MDWFRLERLVDHQIDRSWAEPVRIIPQSGGNQYRTSAADPDREVFELNAVLWFDSGEGDMGGEGGSTWATRMPNGGAMMTIDPTTWPQANTIRSGDLVKAISRAGQPEFTIEKPDTMAVNILKFVMTAR